MDRIFQQMKTFYEGLDEKRRRLLWTVLVGSLIAILGVGVWATQESYRPVATGTHDDVLMAAGALDQAGVPYRLSDTGTVLEVPEAWSGRARMAIAGMEVPADSIQMEIGITPKLQDYQIKLAMEQAIARNINMLDVVRASRVTIVPPKDSRYFEPSTLASAAVVVDLKAGGQLNGQSVGVIANLVANSVPGLTADHVTITDQRGTSYREGGGEDDTYAMNSDRLEFQQMIEEDYEEKIRDAIGTVIGIDNIAVSANVDLDMTEVQIERKELDPETSVLVSETLSESTSENNKTSGGIPGATANQPAATATERNELSNASDFQTASNYDFSQTLTRERIVAGNIKRLAVSVTINEEVLADFDEAQAALVKTELERSVQAAVGYQESRQDNVEVSFLPFTPVQMVEGSGGVALTTLTPYLSYAVALLALTFFFFFVVRPLIGLVVRPDQESRADGASEGREEEGDLALRLRMLVENYEPVDAEDLNRLVDREADAAAQVIRLWSRD